MPRLERHSEMSRLRSDGAAARARAVGIGIRARCVRQRETISTACDALDSAKIIRRADGHETRDGCLGPGRIRSVEGMTATTSTIPAPHRRGLSPIAAALLTIAGNMLVVTIAAMAAVGVVAAAVLVFGGSLLDLA